MMDMQMTEFTPDNQKKVISFMTGLSLACKDQRLVDMCLLELLALVSFAPHDDKTVWS